MSTDSSDKCYMNEMQTATEEFHYGIYALYIGLQEFGPGSLKCFKFLYKSTLF